MNRLNTIFSEEAVKAMRRPVDQATTPPSTYYTSKEFYDLELEQIFFKDWLWAGHVEQLDKPGDYIAFDLLGEPIVIARDHSGQLAAFSAVCRHRGAVVITGRGNCNAFKCPYHNWTYDLTGTLIGAAEMDGVKGFDRSQFGLIPLKLETWEGLLFINFDPQSQPLSSYLGDLPERVKNYNLRDMVCVETRTYTFPCNWKSIVENAMEGYHVLGAHKVTLGKVDLRRFSTEKQLHGLYEVLTYHYPKPPHTSFPVIETLTDIQKAEEPYILIYPDLLLWFNPDCVMCYVMHPDGPDRTTVIHDRHIPKASAQRADCERILKYSYGPIIEGINQEDSRIMGQTSKGIGSRLHRPGRYSLHEYIPHRLVQYVLDRVSNKERTWEGNTAP